MPRAREDERAVVVDLRQPQAAILRRHLHPERAELLEAVDDLVGDPCLALDAQRVDLTDQEVAQRGEEALALLDGRRVELGLWMDQVEAEVAEEELLAEARQLPFALARRLGDLPCLLLGDVGGHVDVAPLVRLVA